MADIKYEITEELGVLSEKSSGWTKELNRISWNGGAAKFDIRDWAPGTRKNGKRRHPYRRGSKTALQAAGRIFRIGGDL